MNGHECYIIGAGDFFGLRETPDDDDNGSAAIVVNKVFLEDAQAKDSVFPQYCAVRRQS